MRGRQPVVADLRPHPLLRRLPPALGVPGGTGTRGIARARRRSERRVRLHACLHLALLAVMSWAASREATAMVVVPATLPDVVASSPVIVHGRVTDVVGRLGDGGIESVVTLAVLEPIKGTPGGLVVLRVPGGQVGRYRRVMVGAPTFERGDEVIVFLAGNGPSVPMPFGVGQGVYRVSRDRAGDMVVTPPLVDVASPGSARLVRGDVSRRPLPVGEFTRRVRAMMAASR
jgi:hypothetical protein